MPIVAYTKNELADLLVTCGVSRKDALTVLSEPLADNGQIVIFEPSFSPIKGDRGERGIATPQQMVQVQEALLKAFDGEAVYMWVTW